jgi:hypothetical protein
MGIQLLGIVIGMAYDPGGCRRHNSILCRIVWEPVPGEQAESHPYNRGGLRQKPQGRIAMRLYYMTTHIWALILKTLPMRQGMR